MEKIFLLIFLMLATPFVFSQEATSQEAKEAKEVVNQFLITMFKNTLTSENITTYVEPLTFKPVTALEDFLNFTTEGDNDAEELSDYVKLDIAVLIEILQFALEKSSYTVGEVQKVHNSEYSVEVSFQFLSLESQSFRDRMTQYIRGYTISQWTIDNRASLTTEEEEFDFVIKLIKEGSKEFKKLPLKDSDFKKESYTFKVARVSEKDKLRITFASEEDLYNFYEIFGYSF